MNKRQTLVSVAVYSAAHFVTDFACAFIIFALVADTGELALKLIIYNFCAFALQMPFGLLADKLNKNSFVAAAGCVVTAVSCAFSFSGYMCVVAAGVGNALFHIGGGLDVMNYGAKRYSMLGVFVAPGALGLFLGTILGKRHPELIAIAPVLLCIFAVLMLATAYLQKKSLHSSNEALSLKGENGVRGVLAVCCLFAVVVLRSYAGTLFKFEWKTGVLAVIFVVGVVLGKALGGVLSDAFGQSLISSVSLCAAGVLFLFGKNPICGTAAVLLFNMTMPVTLGLAARIFNGAKGFMFGLMTFALFVGSLPELLHLKPSFTGNAANCAASAASLVLLLAGIRLAQSEKRETVVKERSGEYKYT